VTAAPGPATWLVLAYRLPANSGLKAVIRRKATALGAVYPASAVAALPASPAAERAFRRLRNMIGAGGGSAQLLRVEPVEGEPDLIAIFNAAREIVVDTLRDDPVRRAPPLIGVQLWMRIASS